MKRMYLSRVLVGMILISLFLFSSQGWAQPKNERNQQQSRMEQRSQDKESPQSRMGQKGISPKHEFDQEDGNEGIRINWRTLNLTREQRQQIQQFRREFQVDTARVRKELQFAERDLHAEIMQDQVDRAKIDSLLQNIADLRQRVSAAAVQNVLAIKSVLTQEQLDILATQQSQIPAVLKQMQLTTEQRSQIEQVIKDSIQKHRVLSDELRELKMELREVLMAPGEVDSGQLQQLQADIAEKEVTLEKSRIENILQIRDVLTPEQRKQFIQFREMEKEKKTPGKWNK